MDKSPVDTPGFFKNRHAGRLARREQGRFSGRDVQGAEAQRRSSDNDPCNRSSSE